MSQIINNVSLAAGLITSAAIANANNVRLHFSTSNVVDDTKEIKINFKVKDGSAKYATLVDERDRSITMSLFGNQEKSRNLFGINSASMIVEVVNVSGLVGNISVWTNES